MGPLSELWAPTYNRFPGGEAPRLFLMVFIAGGISRIQELCFFFGGGGPATLCEHMKIGVKLDGGW